MTPEYPNWSAREAAYRNGTPFEPTPWPPFAKQALRFTAITLMCLAAFADVCMFLCM